MARSGLATTPGGLCGIPALLRRAQTTTGGVLGRLRAYPARRRPAALPDRRLVLGSRRAGFRRALLAALALATTACTLPEAPAREARTNAEAAHGKPYPTQAPEVAGAPTLDIVAAPNPSTAWEKNEYEVAAGVVNISFTSPPGGNHNLNLTGPGAPYPLLWGEPAGAPADHLTFAVNLQRGTYLFYCSVQGHRSGGMEGTITVT